MTLSWVFEDESTPFAVGVLKSIRAAYRQFSEKFKGSIETGKLADLVVIDRDYLTCPEDQIKNIEPVMVVVEGKLAWRR